MAKKKRSAGRRKGLAQDVTESAGQNGGSRLDSSERFRQEYAYVIKDLRQILILAVVMFALLILLNIFLKYPV